MSANWRKEAVGTACDDTIVSPKNAESSFQSEKAAPQSSNSRSADATSAAASKAPAKPPPAALLPLDFDGDAAAARKQLAHVVKYMKYLIRTLTSSNLSRDKKRAAFEQNRESLLAE